MKMFFLQFCVFFKCLVSNCLLKCAIYSSEQLLQNFCVWKNFWAIDVRGRFEIERVIRYNFFLNTCKHKKIVFYDNIHILRNHSIRLLTFPCNIFGAVFRLLFLRLFSISILRISQEVHLRLTASNSFQLYERPNLA